jgi:hypothetical protein
MRIHTNYLRAFAIEPNILRALGVRFILTNTETIDDPGVIRLDVKGRWLDQPHERQRVKLFRVGRKTPAGAGGNPGIGHHFREGCAT